MNNNFTWNYMGTLYSPAPISTEHGGVYLLVFRGTPKRVIYVGTTNSFHRRIYQHQQGMLTGRRTVWRSDSSNDIYELMSFNGERKPFYEYYHSLAKKNLLWATTAINREVPANDLLKKDSFESNWQEFVQNSYIKNIEVWICCTPNNEEIKLRIESQIQNIIKINYSIGSHIHSGKNDMCWLGKIHFGDEVFKSPYIFSNTPDISNEFSMLLNEQISKNVIKYLKPSIIAKKAEAEKSLNEIREAYKFSGTPWDDKEGDILLTCLHKNIPLIVIAKEYLFRTPKEIAQKYSTLSKLYKLPKLR